MVPFLDKNFLNASSGLLILKHIWTIIRREFGLCWWMSEPSVVGAYDQSIYTFPNIKFLANIVAYWVVWGLAASQQEGPRFDPQVD